MTPDVAQAIAEDADSLAVLYDRELTAEVIDALRASRFPSCLGLVPRTEAARHGWAMMAAVVAGLPAHPSAAELDALAADYAATMLTGAHGASPCESAWTDDEHLVCQEAMFALRERLAAAGLAAENWRRRPDDHLVLQLLLLARMARTAAAGDDWRRLATLLDQHLLRWLPDFAARLASRADHPFYAGLAALTAAWLDTLRDMLALALDEPRPSREAIEAGLRRPPPAATYPLAYLPGQAPSW